MDVEDKQLSSYFFWKLEVGIWNRLAWQQQQQQEGGGGGWLKAETYILWGYCECVVVVAVAVAAALLNHGDWNRYGIGNGIAELVV